MLPLLAGGFLFGRGGGEETDVELEQSVGREVKGSRAGREGGW
jgi:hypothetical protein